MWKHFQFNLNTVNFSCDSEESFNEFDTLLREEWSRTQTQGLLTFKIDEHAKQRILDDGRLNYIIELNRGRQETRRPAYSFDRVNVPFDDGRFHFNKIKDAEILFSLDDAQQVGRNLVIINNAPIRPYHVLLVPSRHLQQAQVLTVDCIVFGCEFVVSSAHPYILAGFNSLCGYASVNHLHLHGMYMPGRLFIQTITCSLFHAKTNLYLMNVFKAEALAFEIQHVDEFDRVAQNVYKITTYLSSNNIAHNVTIIKGKSFSSSKDVLRILIWYRQSVLNAKRFERCNFACIELAGFMTIPSEEVYDSLTESELCDHMNGLALPLEAQNRIKDDIRNLLDS